MDTNPSETSELNEFINKYSPFLVEIRKRILITLIIVTAASIFGFIFYERIIRFIIDLLSLKGINIVFTSPFQFISLAISCGVAVGLVIAFPLLIYQILSFLKPALKDKEFTLVVRLFPISVVLFLSGFLFGILIMKWQIEIFLDKSVSLGIGNILDINHLISTVMLVSVLMGIAFQFPLIIFFLLRLGIIKSKDLSKHRLWVYLGSFLFAVLLPADSIIADVFLSLPLIVLFELTLVLDRIFRKRKTVNF